MQVSPSSFLTCHVHFQSSKTNIWQDCAKITRPRWPGEGKSKNKGIRKTIFSYWNSSISSKYLQNWAEREENKTGIESMKFLLDRACKASIQECCGERKRHRSNKASRIATELAPGRKTGWTTVHCFFCSTKPSPANLSTASQTVEETTWTRQKDPAEPECAPLCCTLNLIYKTNVTQEYVPPIAAYIKPLQPALLFLVNGLCCFLKWMH